MTINGILYWFIMSLIFSYRKNHRLERTVDWQWPLSCVRSMSLEFSATSLLRVRCMPTPFHFPLLGQVPNINQIVMFTTSSFMPFRVGTHRSGMIGPRDKQYKGHIGRGHIVPGFVVRTSEPSICQAKVGAGRAFFTTQFTSVLTPENQQAS